MGQLIRPDAATEILPPEPKWRRNGYWLPITTPSDSEEKCVILKAVFNSTQEWCALSAAGDYTVDWGDGNIVNYASGVTAEHTYDYANANLHDTSAELGFKQCIIQIYPQSGQHLTGLNLHIRHSAAGSAVYDSGFLDIAIVGQYLTDLLIGSSNTTTDTQLIRHQKTEQFYLSVNNISNFNWLLSRLEGLVRLKKLRCETGTSHKGLLNFCRALTDICSLDTSNSLNTSYIHYSNTSAKIFPKLDLSKSQNIDNMYSFIHCAETLPDIIAPVAVSAISCVSGNRALKKSPRIYAPICTNVNSFFSQNFRQYGFNSFTIGQLTTAQSLFNTLVNIEELPENIDFTVCTDITSLCAILTKVKKLPTTWTFPLVVTATSAFSSMFLLEKFDKDLPNCQNFTNLFNGNAALRKVGTINAANGTVFTGIVTGCGNLEEMILQGCKYTVSISSCKFPRANIEAFLAALGSAASGTQTVTIAGNPGTGTIYSKTATTTAGSKTVTMADTSNVNVGDRMTGTGSPLTTAIAVTFTDTGDLVNLTNHQLPAGHPVSFVTIVTTTGIAVRTIYYVVNPNANNFQLAATVGGAAITLTNNGSGTMIYDAVIESIEPNVSVTLSAPATSSSTGSKSFRSLNTAPAVLRGFTISG